MLRLPNSIGSKLINPNFNYNISRISCFNILRINYFSTNVFNDKTVDFQNLPFNEKFVNNLKSLGIDNLKLFQYYTFKLLTDKLAFLPFNSLINSRINNEERLKIVLYNDLNTGKTIGTLLPFLYRFSTAHSNYNETTVNGFDRKLLIICNNNNEVKKLINFIISVDSSLNIAQLTGYNIDNGVKAAFVLVLDKHLIQIRESVLRSHDFEFVLFTNFTETINCNNVGKLLKLFNNSNVICLINSLDGLRTFSNKYLQNFSLYNFVQGIVYYSYIAI